MSSPGQEFVLFTGPIFFGTVFNWALLGTLTVQLYIFYLSFPKERRIIKALVYTMYVLDLFQTAATTHFGWFLLVGGWGDPSVFLAAPWPISIVQPVVTGIISASAQIYFSWRIHILKPRSPIFQGISLLIVLVALMQCASAFANAVKISIASRDFSSIASLETTVITWLGGSFAADVIMASTMVFILVQARRRSASKRTDALLKRLIVSTVETGAVTAFTAGANLFLYIANKNAFIHICPSLLLGKLYTIVVVASLNGRSRMNVPDVDTSEFNVSLESHQLRRRDQTANSGTLADGTERTGPLVHVSTDIKHFGDIENQSATTVTLK